MRLWVNGASYEADTWREALTAALMAAGVTTTSNERTETLNALNNGHSTIVAGLLVKPDGARE